MSALTNQSKNIIINFFRGTTPTPPAELYIGLFTSATTDAGDGTELDYPSYARQEVVLKAPVTAGETSNDDTVMFPAFDGSGDPTITHAAVFTAATDGTMLLHGPLLVSKPVTSGDVLLFTEDSLAFSVD